MTCESISSNSLIRFWISALVFPSPVKRRESSWSKSFLVDAMTFSWQLINKPLAQFPKADSGFKGG